MSAIIRCLRMLADRLPAYRVKPVDHFDLPTLGLGIEAGALFVVLGAFALGLVPSVETRSQMPTCFAWETSCCSARRATHVIHHGRRENASLFVQPVSMARV
jgi:hypothetical protein